MHPPNNLIHTTSPYLLQHAYNPVHWHPWRKEILTKAQKEDKPILLSIGYTACHWCHVMAKQSFERTDIAAIMNEHFVCIKVDREERPDLDQIYVAALQAMGIDAGWPLHAFLLPNQQPFYGGTYFSPIVWKQILLNIIHAFQNQRKRLELSAGKFTQALQSHTMITNIPIHKQHAFNPSFIQLIFEHIYQQLDHIKGGIQGTPKFPMPSLHKFLLDYYLWKKDERARIQLGVLLKNMAYGGIYDQLGGGFARYATDINWLIPHFEKMLYDNAQLISLYAQSYLTEPLPLYAAIVHQTIDCITKEMQNADGGFYSALDADIEGVEGKFYIWTQAEIEYLLGPDAPLVINYYHVTKPGNWEKGYNILYRDLEGDNKLALFNKKNNQYKLKRARNILLNYRNQRSKLTVDDKIIASWNGMIINALIDAYYALDHSDYLKKAKETALFINHHLIQGPHIWHSYRRGELGPKGYLEDYAWIVKAWITLYQATFEEYWLEQAAMLINSANKRFWSEKNKLFYFTEKQESDCISRPKEIFDQVIPSSNAVMAHNLWDLGTLLGHSTFEKQAQKMLKSILPLLTAKALYSSHWASLYIKQLRDIPTVAIIGPDCLTWAKEIKKKYLAIAVSGTTKASTLPLLADKQMIESKSTIYICYAKTCRKPVQDIVTALQQLSYLV